MTPRLTFVLLARIPPDGVAAFRAYEDGVLPLLSRYGGELERRLRTGDGQTEIHVVSFPSAEAFAAYRADPDRESFAGLLTGSGADLELHEVTDVEVPASDPR